MRRWGYWALVCAVMAAAGCASMHRPYAHDPLLRSTRGVWGDPARGRVVDSTPPAEPDAPYPPAPIELRAVEPTTAKPR